jgi:hypothetical protein
LKELDSQWDDDDIDVSNLFEFTYLSLEPPLFRLQEIVIMAPKSSGRLPTIVEDLSEVDDIFKVRPNKSLRRPGVDMLK